MRTQPYLRPEDDLLACITQMLLVLLFFCGILIQAFEAVSSQHVDEQDGIEAAAAGLGFGSTDAIVTVLILATVGMLGVLIFTIGLQGAKARLQKLEASKWACTVDATAPVFEWRTNGTYACFLSH